MLKTFSLLAIITLTSFQTLNKNYAEEKSFCEGVKYFIKAMSSDAALNKLKGEVIEEDLYYSKVIIKGWENESILDDAKEFSFSTYTKPAADEVTNAKYLEVKDLLIKCAALKLENASAETEDYFSCPAGNLHLQLLLFPKTDETQSYIGLTIRKSKK